MLIFNFRKKTGQTPKTISLKDYAEIKHSICLFMINIQKNKHVDIKIDKGESELNEKEALEVIEKYRNKKYNTVRLSNHRSGQLITYLNKTGRVIIKNLKDTPQKPVDMNAFIKAIQVTADDYQERIIPPYLFSIIFKLLKDEAIGIGYRDLTQVYFRKKMADNGFKTEGRSSFSKYVPKGFYPKWSYGSEFKLSSAKRIEEAIAFSKKFICNYNNQISE